MLKKAKQKQVMCQYSNKQMIGTNYCTFFIVVSVDNVNSKQIFN